MRVLVLCAILVVTSADRPSNGYGAPPKPPSNGYGAPSAPSNGYGAPPSNSYGPPRNGYGVDPLAALAENIPGGGIPGEDYPVLAFVPDTGFDCNAQNVPGYYADTDPEAGCQVFHICQDRPNGRRQQDSFLCPNGTIFNQQYLVCDWWFNFDCADAESFYSVNELIGVVPYGYGQSNGNGNNGYGSNGNGNGNNGYGSNGNGKGNNGYGSNGNGNGNNGYGSNGNGSGNNGYGSNGNGKRNNGYGSNGSRNGKKNGNGKRNGNGNGYGSNGNGNGTKNGNGYGVDPLAALAENIPGGGIPGEDYPVLASVPDTGFDCNAQNVPGYYADTDPEAGCQVFHICQNRPSGRRQQDSFLCPNGTIFNQQYLVCDWWFNFDCADAEDFYSVNELIGVQPYGYGKSNGNANNGYGSNGNGNGNNGYGSNGNGNGNGRRNNGYGSNGGRNGKKNGNGKRNGNANGNGYGANGNGAAVSPNDIYDPLAVLAKNIPGGGVPGVDYPVLSSVPDTGFDCNAQNVPGYYADTDPEAGCQVFHICQNRPSGRRQQDSFLCPNGTIFNQKYLVCDWWFNFDCADAESFYSVNELIGVVPYGYGKSNGNGNNGYGSNGNGNGNNGYGSNGNGNGNNGNGRRNNGYGSNGRRNGKKNGNGKRNGNANGNGYGANGNGAANGNGKRNGNGNGNGYGANGNGAANGYGVDPLAALAENIPGGGIPGEDYPVLAFVPDTGFDCNAQNVPGYYADTDPEAGCQVFHICQDRPNGRRQQDSFLCPNGTIFNQQYLVCDWWFNFDCADAEDFYSVNELIGVQPYGYGKSNGNGNGNNGYGSNGNKNGNNGYGSNGNGNGNNGYGSNGNGNGNNGYGSNGNGNGNNGYGSNGNGKNGNGKRNNGYGSNGGRNGKKNGNGKRNGNGNGNGYGANGNGAPSSAYGAPF
ncbi:pro-resilin-like [Macrobrachium rosenbergii]|uniref:pro-resilin-like n=1 Tax=Macrobrachium rosenbergii TaxID=79674 RepID=UPI0034D6C572